MKSGRPGGVHPGHRDRYITDLVTKRRANPETAPTIFCDFLTTLSILWRTDESISEFCSQSLPWCYFHWAEGCGVPNRLSATGPGKCFNLFVIRTRKDLSIFWDLKWL